MDPGTDLAVEKPGHRSGGRPGDSTGHRKAGDSAVTGITWAQTGHRHDLGTDLGTGDHVDHFSEKSMGTDLSQKFVGSDWV